MTLKIMEFAAEAKSITQDKIAMALDMWANQLFSETVNSNPLT